MAIMDLYRVIIKSRVFTEECYNTFWFRQIENDTGGNIAQGLADQMNNWFVDELAAYMSEDAQFESVTVYNYSNSLEIGANNTVVPGAVLQESAPSQWCVGFKMARGGIGWNYPRKRVSGFPISVYLNNSIEPGLQTILTGIADDWRSFTIAGAQLIWRVIRPDVGFKLDNPVVLGERNVGACISVYDASQMSRKN